MYLQMIWEIGMLGLGYWWFSLNPKSWIDAEWSPDVESILPHFFFLYGSCYEIKGKSIIVAIVQKQAVKMLGTCKFCHQSADCQTKAQGAAAWILSSGKLVDWGVKDFAFGMPATCTPTQMCLFLWQKLWILLCLKILCYRFCLF